MFLDIEASVSHLICSANELKTHHEIDLDKKLYDPLITELK